jgi:hypothetical protein
MDPLSTPHVAARRGTEPARTDDGTDLVIVVLDELACTGRVRGCTGICGADYASPIPAAIAA